MQINREEKMINKIEKIQENVRTNCFIWNTNTLKISRKKKIAILIYLYLPYINIPRRNC